MKDKLTWELQAYGSPADDIIASYLSDAQEMLERDNKNASRQYINIAKMLMMHYDLGFKRA